MNFVKLYSCAKCFIRISAPFIELIYPYSFHCGTKMLVSWSGCNMDSVGLPDPELYILVSGKLSKQKVLWQSMVNIAQVRAAIQN